MVWGLCVFSWIVIGIVWCVLLVCVWVGVVLICMFLKQLLDCRFWLSLVISLELQGWLVLNGIMWCNSFFSMIELLLKFILLKVQCWLLLQIRLMLVMLVCGLMFRCWVLKWFWKKLQCEVWFWISCLVFLQIFWFSFVFGFSCLFDGKWKFFRLVVLLSIWIFIWCRCMGLLGIILSVSFGGLLFFILLLICVWKQLSVWVVFFVCVLVLWWKCCNVVLFCLLRLFIQVLILVFRVVLVGVMCMLSWFFVKVVVFRYSSLVSGNWNNF